MRGSVIHHVGILKVHLQAILKGSRIHDLLLTGFVIRLQWPNERSPSDDRPARLGFVCVDVTYLPQTENIPQGMTLFPHNS
jgi:hypothetical protein